MNSYLSSLIQQTGLKLGRQGESRTYRQQSNENISDQSHAIPEHPEPLEVEEMIEVTAPSGSATPNHHETTDSVDKGILKDSEEKSVTRQVPYPADVSKQCSEPSGPEIITPSKGKIAEPANASYETIAPVENNFIPREQIQANAKQQTQTEKTNSVNSVKPERETSSRIKKMETVTEFESQPTGSEASLSAEPQTTTQHAGSPSPGLLEQHVYISQLPDSYQQAIKEWLVSPTDGSKNQVSGREKLKAAIKKKQNTTAILKLESTKSDSFPDKQIGNEPVKTRDVHLSVGNINLTIAEPKQAKKQAPQATNKPVRRQQYGSSRLSRQYVRIR